MVRFTPSSRNVMCGTELNRSLADYTDEQLCTCQPAGPPAGAGGAAASASSTAPSGAHGAHSEGSWENTQEARLALQALSHRVKRPFKEGAPGGKRRKVNQQAKGGFIATAGTFLKSTAALAQRADDEKDKEDERKKKEQERHKNSVELAAALVSADGKGYCTEGAAKAKLLAALRVHKVKGLSKLNQEEAAQQLAALQPTEEEKLASQRQRRELRAAVGAGPAARDVNVLLLSPAKDKAKKVKYKNDTKLAKVRSDMKDWGLVTGRATQSALVINMVMQSDYSITLAQAKVSATGITVIEGVDA